MEDSTSPAVPPAKSVWLSGFFFLDAIVNSRLYTSQLDGSCFGGR